MTSQGNSHIPLLGQQPTHAGAQVAAMVRHLDENGMLSLSNGGLARTEFLDAQELIALIRAAVREEMTAILKERPS